MAIVTLSPDRQSSRDIDVALRKLKKIMERNGVLKTLHEKEAYERPGERRIRKRAAAVMRQKREQAKNQLPIRRNNGNSI